MIRGLYSFVNLHAAIALAFDVIGKLRAGV